MPCMLKMLQVVSSRVSYENVTRPESARLFSLGLVRTLNLQFQGPWKCSSFNGHRSFSGYDGGC